MFEFSADLAGTFPFVNLGHGQKGAAGQPTHVTNNPATPNGKFIHANKDFLAKRTGSIASDLPNPKDIGHYQGKGAHAK